MSDSDRLELCQDHKQEWKQSHFAEHNCDYCKLEKEVERLRAEVQRLDIAGIHSCHDDCPKLPCVQRREIDRLRAEVESVIRLGPHPVEQVEMPLDVFVKTRFVPVWEYNELADKVHKLEAELAAAKAASVVPVRVLNIFEGTYESDRYIELRTDAEADTFTDWLRERMKGGER